MNHGLADTVFTLFNRDIFRSLAATIETKSANVYLTSNKKATCRWLFMLNNELSILKHHYFDAVDSDNMLTIPVWFLSLALSAAVAPNLS